MARIKPLFNHLDLPTRLLLLFFAVFLCMFSAGRVIFFLIHKTAFMGHEKLNLIFAFIYGIRFDLAISSILIIPGWLASFGFRWGRQRMAIGLSSFFVIPWLAALFILFVDILYYGESGRRLSYEIFNIRNDLFSTLKMVSHYKLALTLFFFLAVGLTWAGVSLTRYLWDHTPPVSWKKRVVSLLLGVLFLVVAIRGGIQSKPLRPSFAFIPRTPGLAHLILNPAYTVMYSLKKGRVDIPNLIAKEEALTRVRNLAHSPGGKFLSDQYPLLQTPMENENPAPFKPNIVIFLLESWSGKYVGALGSNLGITPHFDELASRGKLFSQFFAIGHRSTDGITATCCSVLTFQDLQIIGSSFEQNNFRCVGTLLKEEGYSTLFLHGAKTGSFGLNGFARVAGFDRYLGKEDFDIQDGDTDPVWGIFDHVALNRLNNELRTMKSPFLALWFSLTSHSPFNVPENSPKPIPAGDPQHEYFNALAYTDKSLGEFFNNASKEKYFENTIFILLADHTTDKGLNGPYERQHVPFLIFSPKLISPGRVETVAGQMDVLPTILGLIGSKKQHHSFGKSLFEISSPSYAFVDQGPTFGWFKNSFLLMAGSNRPLGLYNWKEDSTHQVDLTKSYPDVFQTMKNDLYSFVQVSKELLRDNRLAPKISSSDFPQKD